MWKFIKKTKVINNSTNRINYGSPFDIVEISPTHTSTYVN